MRVIFSHPQSLAQCRRFLEDNFPNAEPVASLSNSAAVTDMLESGTTAAAIAPQKGLLNYTGQYHRSGHSGRDKQCGPGLSCLAGTTTPPRETTRHPSVFPLTGDAPGSLYNALGIFATRDINLVKIESRPTKESLGRYNFLVDCEGHRKTGSSRQP